MTVGIAANCNNVLAFLLTVALKALQVMAEPLLLKPDKRAHDWFHKWADLHLTQHPTYHKHVLQYCAGLTGVLSEVTMYLQNTESRFPVVTDQREADKEMHGWERLSLTAHQVIPSASVFYRLTILLVPPPSLHKILNACITTALQDDCALTHSVKKASSQPLSAKLFYKSTSSKLMTPTYQKALLHSS